MLQLRETLSGIVAIVDMGSEILKFEEKPPSPFCGNALAYRTTGMTKMAEAVQARMETSLEMKGVLHLGEFIGWQTAIYLSALIMNKNMELVNWLMLVLIM